MTSRPVGSFSTARAAGSNGSSTGSSNVTASRQACRQRPRIRPALLSRATPALAMTIPGRFDVFKVDSGHRKVIRGQDRVMDRQTSQARTAAPKPPFDLRSNVPVLSLPGSNAFE
jgi:hypothetical protein